MKKNLEKLIQIACLRNDSLKTVIKARSKLKQQITTAFNLINELLTVNASIDKTKNKFDAALCDKSVEIFDHINKMDVFKYSQILTDLFENHDQELVHMADDLIDLIDESTGKILARHNPLKGKKFSPIPQ